MGQRWICTGSSVWRGARRDGEAIEGKWRIRVPAVTCSTALFRWCLPYKEHAKAAGQCCSKALSGSFALLNRQPLQNSMPLRSASLKQTHPTWPHGPAHPAHLRSSLACWRMTWRTSETDRGCERPRVPMRRTRAARTSASDIALQPARSRQPESVRLDATRLVRHPLRSSRWAATQVDQGWTGISRVPLRLPPGCLAARGLRRILLGTCLALAPGGV